MMHISDAIVFWAPFFVAVFYAATATAYLCKRDWPWAVIWFSYAAGNVGLIWAAAARH